MAGLMAGRKVLDLPFFDLDKFDMPLPLKHRLLDHRSAARCLYGGDNHEIAATNVQGLLPANDGVAATRVVGQSLANDVVTATNGKDDGYYSCVTITVRQEFGKLGLSVCETGEMPQDRRLWDYGIKWVCEIMQRTSSDAGNLKGRTSLEQITGDTPDISEYLDFRFYDRVWYNNNAGLGETKLGRWLGVAHRYGSLMNYWILQQNGTIISCCKALYGLRSSGKCYHERFAETMKELGFFISKADSDEWMRENDGKYEYVCVYVDDLLIAMKDPKEFTMVR